jgi:hypothetical protein
MAFRFAPHERGFYPLFTRAADRSLLARDAARGHRRTGRGAARAAACTTQAIPKLERMTELERYWIDVASSTPAIKRLSAIRWIVARDIVLAWVLTIPMAAPAAAVAFEVVHVLVPEHRRPARALRVFPATRCGTRRHG